MLQSYNNMTQTQEFGNKVMLYIKANLSQIYQGYLFMKYMKLLPSFYFINSTAIILGGYEKNNIIALAILVHNVPIQTTRLL